MCKIRVGIVAFMLLVVMQGKLNAQDSETEVNLQTIEPYILAVSYEHTTNIIFPYAIKSVDRGSMSVLAQKAKGVENVLQLKAGRKSFSPTNVSVITADGHFYSFLLEYADQPSALNIKIEKEVFDGSHHVAIQLANVPFNVEAFNCTTAQLLKRPLYGNIHAKAPKLRLTLRGIFVHPESLWFTFQLRNQSTINYRPDQVRFFIQDRRRSKRTAVQEKQIYPLYHNADSIIPGGKLRAFAFVFKPFTVPLSQQLVMRMSEQGSGRPISLRIKPKWLLKARLIK